jgi:uncharacterized protein (TIGR01319 family)
VGTFLLVDFGSTWTKVLAVDTDEAAILGSAQAPTTVDIDVNIGLGRALEELADSSGLDPDRVDGRYASSSAAGGLRMAALGLVPELTLEAARRACLGAGAKVVCGYGFEADRAIIREIEAARCDIVLLCGGTDGGDKKVITHNARMLAESSVECPILVAGNRVVSENVTEVLAGRGKRVYNAANVLPSLDVVQVEPAQALIREIFITHITKAKGLDSAAPLFDKPIVPTPMATLRAATLLADGAGAEPGIGSLLVVEVGGATTNVHSVAEQSPATPQTFVRGLPESRVKRTVEGDLGIRYNAPTIYQHISRDTFFSRLRDISPDEDPRTFDPAAYVEYLAHNVGHVPSTDLERGVDVVLAQAAATIAAQRHAGTLRHEFSVVGEIAVQHGKNLLPTENVIGTGGIFRYGVRPERVLRAAVFSPDEPWSLRPRHPRAFTDTRYMLYGTGLLAEDFPEAALRIAKRYLEPAPLELD